MNRLPFLLALAVGGCDLPAPTHIGEWAQDREDGVDDRTLGEREGAPVAICHIPPGRPEEAVSLCVDEAALQGHLSHGDDEGLCSDEESDPCAEGERVEEPEEETEMSR